MIFNVNPTDWRKHHGVQSSDPTFKDPPQLISPPGSTRLRKPLDGVPSRQLRIHPQTNPPEFSDEQTHKNTHTDIQLWKNMHSVCSQLGLHGEMERLKMNGWTERGKKSQRCRVKSEGCPISLSHSESSCGDTWAHSWFLTQIELMGRRASESSIPPPTAPHSHSTHTLALFKNLVSRPPYVAFWGTVGTLPIMLPPETYALQSLKELKYYLVKYPRWWMKQGKQKQTYYTNNTKMLQYTIL